MRGQLRDRRSIITGAKDLSVLYDRPYFLSHCGGHELYAETKGERLDSRLAIVLQMSRIASGMRVLDLGCGRGELTLHGARQGAFAVGLDFSKVALDISKETIGKAKGHVTVMPGLARGRSDLLPFRDKSFDRVLLSDVLEHLSPAEMKGTLREVHRVLTDKGLLIFHTFPNRWFYSVYYPVRRLLWDRPKGKAGPRNPRTYYECTMHVNELSPLGLLRAMRPLFQVKIHCAHRSRWDPSCAQFRCGGGPLDWFREPEIWGLAYKRS